MDLTLRQHGARFVRCATWKMTWLALNGQSPTNVSIGTPPRRFFESMFLCNRWFRCHAQLSRFYPVEERISRIWLYDLPAKRFELEFDRPRQPVVIQGATETWPCRRKWTLEDLERRSNVKWQISHALDDVDRLEMTMANYRHYCSVQTDENPLYIFDSNFGEKVPSMLQDYDMGSFGELFQEDFLGLLEDEKRPNFRWFVAGPARTGAPWHKDPKCTSAWNALLKGHKRWALYPPHKVPPGVEAVFSDETESVLLGSNSISSLQWFLDIYPLLSEDERPLEVLQRPGDVIFVPSGWWHMVLNLEDTISVTQNFASRANLRVVVHDICRSSGVRFAKELQSRLLKEYPEMRNDWEDILRPLQQGFESDFAFKHSFCDLSQWKPHLDRIMHEFTNSFSVSNATAYAVLTKRLNPTFLHLETNSVIKIFSQYPSGDVSLEVHGVEPADPSQNGERSFLSETSMLDRIEKVLVNLPVPRILGRGRLRDDSPWPYVIQSRLEGSSMGSLRKFRHAHLFDFSTVASELGMNLGSMHRTFATSEGNEKYVHFLRQRRLYNVASHLRRGFVPWHLQASIPEFLDKNWHRIAFPRVLTSVHADLQEENILVRETFSFSPQAAREVLCQLCLANMSFDQCHAFVSRLVDVEGLRVHDFVALGLEELQSFGIERELGIRLKHELEWCILEDSRTHLAGIIDFADSFVADPLYEVVALHVSAFRCDKTLLREFVKAYREHSRFSFKFDANALMCLTILHNCDGLALLTNRQPNLNQLQTWDEVANAVFGA